MDQNEVVRLVRCGGEVVAEVVTMQSLTVPD